MSTPKLILIEGLPSFGKTTTATIVAAIFAEQNQDVQLFLEGNLDHPADYDGVAFLGENEFAELTATHESCTDLFQAHAEKHALGVLLPYQKIQREHGYPIPAEVLSKLYQADVYEQPLAMNKRLITDKWSAFVEQARSGSSVYIFDCSFIQNPVTVSMIKHDAPADYVTQYVRDLAAIIEPLTPLLLYVDQDDLAAAFRKAVQERPQEWIDGFVAYYTGQGYGKANRLTGVDGTLQVLQARKSLEAQIFAQLRMQKQIITNAGNGLEAYENQLRARLSDGLQPKR